MSATRVSSFVHAVRHTARNLAGRPAFSLPVLMTMSLAIGAAVMAFSVIDNVLLKPLPYPDPDAIIDIVHEAPAAGLDVLYASPAIYFAYRDHNESFAAIGLWDSDDSPATITGAGEPEAVPSVQVTHEILPILGAAPLAGRLFTAADDQQGSAPTAIISHRYWQRRFGGADVVGRTLVVQGVTREVIGVLPPAFRFFDYDVDVLYPLQPRRTDAAFGRFDGRAIARLRDGVTLAAANADVRRMVPILEAEFPPQDPSFSRSGFTPRLRTLKDSVVGDLGDTLWTLFGTTALLLLTACASVANLVLLRNESRRHEVGIRMALGANEARIAALVATEGVLLTLVAGVLGFAGGAAALPSLLARSADLLPGVTAVDVDLRVALFTSAIALVAGFSLALVPALRLARSSFVRTLHRGAGMMTDGPQPQRVRHTLVVIQVALAVLLLVGSGLMARTFTALRDVPPGFEDPGSIQTFQVTLPVTAGGPFVAEQTVRAHRAILERLRTVNGVASAAFAAFDDALPLDGDGRSATVQIEQRDRAYGSEPVREIQFVAPGFFETLGTPLVAGRALDWNDAIQRRPVAVISANMAIEEWGSTAAALGKRVRPNPAAPWFEVVGVHQPVHHDGLDRPAPGAVTLPVQTGEGLGPVQTATYVVRSERVGTPGFVRELQDAVWREQPAVSLLNVRTLGDLYRRSLVRTSLTLTLLAIMAALAMLLGTVGVAGAIGYTVMQRRQEIGIRRALGAPAGQIQRRFLKQAIVLAGAGVAIGIAAAAGFSRALSSQLYGVSAFDPLTYAAVAGGLLLAAALASYWPARRAANVDPMEALRSE